MRLFVALCLPDEHRRRIADVLPRWDAVRWVKPEALHLTLEFLGEIELTPELGNALRQAVAPSGPIRIELTEFGTFPRVVWVGVGGDVARMVELARSLEGAASGFGVAPEEREFVPHITVGRMRRGTTHRLSRQLPELPALPDFTVREAVLYGSELRPDGPVYSPLLRLPFG